jgi:hypothetical protein
LTQYKEAENSGTFCKEHLDNVLLQYSEDVAGELSSSITKSENKKARFEVLAQYTYSKDEEEDTKPPAKKPTKDKTEEDDLKDLEEKDPKFRIFKRRHRDDPQLTLTQFWPDDKKA